MTLYKNISNQTLFVGGFTVKSGDTTDQELIENPNFEVVSKGKSTEPVSQVSPALKDDVIIKDENKEIK